MTNPIQVQITSFGYLHSPAPDADITVDLRTHFRDPHLAPGLRHLTAHDQAVRDAVMDTPGIQQLITGLVAVTDAYLAGPTRADLTIALGCAGGRHRAAVTAAALHAVLTADPQQAAEYGLEHAVWRLPLAAELVHRDLHRPVVHR
jgi:UPF0042 nucleotide-binding protein